LTGLQPMSVREFVQAHAAEYAPRVVAA